MKNPDWNVVLHMRTHCKEIVEESVGIDSLEAFSASGPIRKAIIFDLTQIGELANRLSPRLKGAIGSEEVGKVVGMRNVFVHGYGEIDDSIVYSSLKNDLDGFMDRVWNCELEICREYLSDLNGKKTEVVFEEEDAPAREIEGSIVREGYCPSITWFSSSPVRILVIAKGSLIDRTEAMPIGIVENRDDDPLKLIAVERMSNISQEEIGKVLSLVDSGLSPQLFV